MKNDYNIYLDTAIFVKNRKIVGILYTFKATL